MRAARSRIRVGDSGLKTRSRYTGPKAVAKIFIHHTSPDQGEGAGPGQTFPAGGDMQRFKTFPVDAESTDGRRILDKLRGVGNARHEGQIVKVIGVKDNGMP